MNLTEVYKQCFEPQLKGATYVQNIFSYSNELEKKELLPFLVFEEGLPIHQISFRKGPNGFDLVTNARKWIPPRPKHFSIF